MITINSTIDNFIKKLGLFKSKKESDEKYLIYLSQEKVRNFTEFSDKLFEVIKLAITSPQKRFAVIPKELISRGEVNLNNYDDFIISVPFSEKPSKVIKDKKLELVKLYNLK
jgi:Holliday junction resolvase